MPMPVTDAAHFARLTIDENDIKIGFVHPSRPGGQNVNEPSTADPKAN
jgi:protein subunit release factor B